MTRHANTQTDRPTGRLEAISHPSMVQRWEDLSFIHWAFEPAEVRQLVPADLEIDTFDGAAWVGVIPFRLRIRRPGVPYLPWLSTFAETNVRTYVIGPDGRPGIWFLSLDAERLGAVVVARTSYRLPYVWSQVRMRREDALVHYTGTRRWPRPAARYDLAVRIGDPIPRPGDLERFLTARWHLFSPGRMRLPPTSSGARKPCSPPPACRCRGRPRSHSSRQV